ncbi:MAG: Sua5/YciO/YrdC/YwlC family protein [Ferrimonas sp.]
MSRFITVADAGHLLIDGGLLAYPTEAVFGLGCDPMNQAAVERLLHLKQRSPAKGLILVAASYGQLREFIDDQALTNAQRQTVLSSWPGPYTWIMPAKPTVPVWLTGQFDSLAVRVSNHPIVQDLCCAAGMPLVSTSANLSGQPALNDGQQVQALLGAQLDGVVLGDVGGNHAPSVIRDARTGAVLRG